MDLQRFLEFQKIGNMNTKTKTCLQCGSPVHQRGLCTTCYGRFTRSKQRLSTEKQRSFEEALVDAGKILPPARREPTTHDLFGELADQLQDAEAEKVGEIIEEFRTKNQQSKKPTVQQDADEIARRAKKAAKRKGITPKPKPE
jgi:hypothetical protein